MKKFLKISAFLAFLSFSKAYGVVLNTASVTKTDSGFALQLDLPTTQGIEFSSKVLLADPASGTGARFFVDISPIKLSKQFVPPVFSDDRIKQIRWAQNEKGKVRVVFDLLTSTVPEFTVDKNFKGVMIATFSTAHSTETAQAAPQTMSEKTETPIPTPVVIKPEPTKPEPPKADIAKMAPKTIPIPSNVRKIRVILDAGHGGLDSGAHGKNGTLEKDVTLSIAKKIRELLVKANKYEVIMTRDEDITFDLLDRPKFANKMNGDLFVSIHANASPKRTAKGISTYFLNNADDQDSLRVAMRENGELDPTVLNTPSKNTDDYYLEVMKASMVKNFHTTQSTDLARAVQADLLKTIRKEYTDVVDLGVRSARFYVLTGATMPAILVETSFISNPTEEKRLSDNKYQQSLAKSVVSGLDAFFKNRPAFENGHNVFLSEDNSRKKISRKN